jgi:hypothetical protein
MFRYIRSVRQNPAKQEAEQMRQWEADNARQALEDMNPEQRERYDALEPDVKKAFVSGKLNASLINSATEEPDFYVDAIDKKRMSFQWTALERYIRKMKRYSDRFDVRLVILDIPSGCYVNDAAYKNTQRIGFKTVPEMLTTNVLSDSLKALCRREDVPCVTVTPEMREHRDDPSLYFELDLHFSASGHALFADLITPRIKTLIGPDQGRSATNPGHLRNGPTN